MNMVYAKPVTVAELGTSDHNMVLLKPSSKITLATGNMTRMSVKSMGAKDKVPCDIIAQASTSIWLRRQSPRLYSVLS